MSQAKADRLRARARLQIDPDAPVPPVPQHVAPAPTPELGADQPSSPIRPPSDQPSAGSPTGTSSEVVEAVVWLSCRVSKSLRDEVQHQAIREGRSATALVQDAVLEYLKSQASSS
ncbi:hypothetical protein [Pseudonocardia spinosispora]|uniref:hypothetical protein n=1 Tax=Pseudonocardia spinosispora TaxID=103441 RepID=UPI0012EC91A9|nr:hypothetical protein [Pseudonocardia spinosispora]